MTSTKLCVAITRRNWLLDFSCQLRPLHSQESKKNGYRERLLGDVLSKTLEHEFSPYSPCDNCMEVYWRQHCHHQQEERDSSPIFPRGKPPCRFYVSLAVVPTTTPIVNQMAPAANVALSNSDFNASKTATWFVYQNVKNSSTGQLVPFGTKASHVRISMLKSTTTGRAPPVVPAIRSVSTLLLSSANTAASFPRRPMPRSYPCEPLTLPPPTHPDPSVPQFPQSQWPAPPGLQTHQLIPSISNSLKVPATPSRTLDYTPYLHFHQDIPPNSSIDYPPPQGGCAHPTPIHVKCPRSACGIQQLIPTLVHFLSSPASSRPSQDHQFSRRTGTCFRLLRLWRQPSRTWFLLAALYLCKSAARGKQTTSQTQHRQLWFHLEDLYILDTNSPTCLRLTTTLIRCSV